MSLKNAELELQFQKFKGRVVLRGDIVKDDSGAFAVFTEQGSSASLMIAAKVMDVIARLPDCDGCSWCSLCLHSGWIGGRSQFAQFSSPNVQTCGNVFHDKNGRNHGQTWKIPWYLLNEIYMVIHLAGLLWETHFEEALLDLHVDDIKIDGWKEAEYGSHVEEVVQKKKLISENLHHFLTNGNQMKRLLKFLFESRIPTGALKNYRVGKSIPRKL